MRAERSETFNLRECFYPANLLTLGRLGLLPLTLAYLRQPKKQRQAFLCLGLAMLTDLVDGSLARHMGQVSRLGEILDPLADKVVLNSVCIVMCQTQQFPCWMTLMLLLRDGGILLSAFLLYQRRAYVATSLKMGRITTTTLTAALFLYLLDGPRSGKPVLYLTLLPFFLSIWQYSQRYRLLMRAAEEAERLKKESLKAEILSPLA